MALRSRPITASMGTMRSSASRNLWPTTSRTVSRRREVRPAWLGSLLPAHLASRAHSWRSPPFAGSPDWIELLNASENPVNLGAFFLSNDAADPYLFNLPAVVLPPNRYLLILASGENKIGRRNQVQIAISGGIE